MLGVDAKVVSGGAEISVCISAECHKHMKGFETDSCAGHDLVRDILSRAKIPFHSLTVVTLSPHQHDKLEDQNQIHLKEPWVENAYSFTRTAAQISQQYPELLSTVTPSTKNEPVSAAFLDLTNTPSSQIKSSSFSSSPLAKAKYKQDASAASTGAYRESHAHSAAAAASSASQKKRNARFPTSSAAARAVDTTMNASRDRAKKAKVEHPPVTAYEAWKRRNPSSGKWNKLSRDEKLRWASVAEKDTRQAAMQRDMFAPFKRQM